MGKKYIIVACRGRCYRINQEDTKLSIFKYKTIAPPPPPYPRSAIIKLTSR